MDEVASNATTDRKTPVLPWPWGLVTGTFFVLFLFTGIGGLLVAVFGKGFIHPTIPFYFQAFTVIVVIVLSIGETGLLVSAIRWVESTKQQQVTLVRSAVFSASGTQLSSIHQDALSQREMRDFHVCHILLVYVCLLGLNTGVLLGFCCLTLLLSYESQPFLKGYLWPFFVVDIIIGLVMPLLISVSLIPIAKTIRYVTNGQIETRKIYRWCLPCLSYERGTKDGYWVIDDAFYFKIGKSLCCGCNTLLIYVMCLMVFLNSWLYFVNAIFTSQQGVEGCHVLSERDKLRLYCFDFYSDIGNIFRVNCSLNSTYENNLFCLEFKNSNLIHTVVVSIVLYYIVATCISVIFQIVRGLLFYSRTGIWSNLVILLGFLVFFLGIAGFVSLYYLHSNFDILSLLQLCTICVCIVTVGILLKKGNPAFGRVTSKTDKDSIALTPANPSDYSVPVSYTIRPPPVTNQISVEVQPPPSVTTEDIQDTGSASQQQVPIVHLPPQVPIPCNHVDTVPIENETHVRQSSQIQPLDSPIENLNPRVQSSSAQMSVIAISSSQTPQNLNESFNSQVCPTITAATDVVSQNSSQVVETTFDSLTLPTRRNNIAMHRLSAAERPLSMHSNLSISSAGQRSVQTIHDGYATVGKRKVTIL